MAQRRKVLIIKKNPDICQLTFLKHLTMFKPKHLTFLFLISLFVSQVVHSQTIYYGKDHFLVEGTAFPESEKESTYDRLPFSYKEKVRPPVWDLSKSSAGLSVRFISNTTSINIKWEVLNNRTMNHMPATGIKGIDLYCKNQDSWQFVHTAIPEGKVNEVFLIKNMTPLMREYKMFLPLYDGLVSLEIGIDSLSIINIPERNNKKSIVFYGTSITQGGCASRPGMAYTNIISRKLDTECLNFGFSGNGKMEAPIAELISDIDALFYVIDCIPNMNAELVRANATPLVEIIRKKRPDTPIVFVESLLRERAYFDDKMRKDIEDANNALRIEFNAMQEKGIPGIYFIEMQGATGTDHEATVDNVHYTDLGFLRFSEFLIEKFEEIGLVNKE